MVNASLESKLVGINNFELTDFSDGMPLKTERIGSCVAVAFYHNNGRLFGALPHPVRGTNPKLFFSEVIMCLYSLGTSAAIIGSPNAHPATAYFIEELVELLKDAYDVRFKGFKKPALRDAVLYPDGTLDVYYYPSYYASPEFEERIELG